MVFFYRNGKNNSPNEDIKSEHKEVYAELKHLEKENINMTPTQKFLVETIKYKGKTEAEFEKESYIPPIKDMMHGEKPSVPGVKPAAEKAFSKKDEVHEEIDSMLNLTFRYGDKVINCYKNKDIEDMLNLFDCYSKKFEERYQKIEEKSRTRGTGIVAAIRQIKIDFLEYQIDILPHVESMKDEVTSTYIS